MSDNDVEHLQNLIANYTRRLQKLQEQQSIIGLSTPPETLLEIENLEQEIQVLEEKLKQEEDIINSLSKIKFTENDLEMKIDKYIHECKWDEAASLLKEDVLQELYRKDHEYLYKWLKEFPPEKQAEYPQLLLSLGQICANNLNQLGNALDIFKVAEKEFQKKGDQVGAARAEVWQSVCWRLKSDPSKAIPLAEEGLARLRKHIPKDKWWIAWARRNRGIAYGTGGDINKAVADVHYALDTFRTLQDPYMVASCHHDLGVLREKQGDYSDAGYHYRRAGEAWRVLEKQDEVANALTGQGNAKSRLGQYQEAVRILEKALKLSKKIKNRRRHAFALTGLGDAYFRWGKFVKAYYFYEESTQCIKNVNEDSLKTLEITNKIGISECRHFIKEQYDPKEQLEWMAQVAKDAEKKGLIEYREIARLTQAKLLARDSQYEPSKKLLKEVINYFSDNILLGYLVEARYWLACVLLYLQEWDEGIKLLAEASSTLPDRETFALGPSFAEVIEKLRQVNAPRQIKEQIDSILNHNYNNFNS